MTRPIILRSFFCAASALGFLVASAAAQPTLERLEDQIRRRTGQPAAEGRPDAAAQSRRPAARNANRQASGQLEPGYLGLVADDQNDRGRGVRVTFDPSRRPGGKGRRAPTRLDHGNGGHPRPTDRGHGRYSQYLLGRTGVGDRSSARRQEAEGHGHAGPACRRCAAGAVEGGGCTGGDSLAAG